MSQTRVLVTGAGGFIGHHLVSYLRSRGYWVRGVDIKVPEYNEIDADEFEVLDLRRWDNCLQATRGIDEVYGLAADMGGMGFISAHHSEILHNNSLITLRLPVYTRNSSRWKPMWFPSRKRMPTRPCPRMPTAGKNW
jgi:GDP-D-mannose 3',5'-epimerase